MGNCLTVVRLRNSSYLEAQKRRIAPIEMQLKELGVSHLIIMPDLALSLVPFHSLQNDGGVALMDRFAVSYAPSFATIVDSLTRRQHSHASKSLLFIHDPTNSLRYASWEREMVCKWFPRESVCTLDSSNADKETIISAARNVDVLHFCTHGRFDSEDPQKSGIALRNGQWLSVAEIGELSLKKSPLVFLSACETARLKLRSRFDSVGISPSFLRAGAATVISSFWAVNDLSTALIAARFYENLIRARMHCLESIMDAAKWVRNLRVGDLRSITRTLTPLSLTASGRKEEKLSTGLLRLTKKPEDQEELPFADYYFWAAFALYGSWE